MTVETEEDLVKLQEIGVIVANCLQLMGQALEPGMTTQELDNLGRKYLEERGARSAPQLTYNFPGTTCISVNHEVAHGIPKDVPIRAGDLVNIDVSAELAGYFADTGGSWQVPPHQKEKQLVCQGAQAALQAAMSRARSGQPLSVIGLAIQQTAAKYRLTVIRNLGSHGVGRALHEEPTFIAPFFDRREKRRLEKGMVITIEPFLSNGASEVLESEDGWTLYTPPRYLSAQFEHTLVITDGDPLVMTRSTLPGIR